MQNHPSFRKYHNTSIIRRQTIIIANLRVKLYLKVEIQSETSSKVQVRQAPRRNPINDHTREKQLLQKSAQQGQHKIGHRINVKTSNDPKYYETYLLKSLSSKWRQNSPLGTFAKMNR